MQCADTSWSVMRWRSSQSTRTTPDATRASPRTSSVTPGSTSPSLSPVLTRCSHLPICIHRDFLRIHWLCLYGVLRMNDGLIQPNQLQVCEISLIFNILQYLLLFFFHFFLSSVHPRDLRMEGAVGDFSYNPNALNCSAKLWTMDLPTAKLNMPRTLACLWRQWVNRTERLTWHNEWRVTFKLSLCRSSTAPILTTELETTRRHIPAVRKTRKNTQQQHLSAVGKVPKTVVVAMIN